MNQIEIHYVLHQCRSETSVKMKGADPWSYSRPKYIRNQTNAATREDTNVEYIPSVASYLSIVRAVQDAKLNIVSNLLRMIGPTIKKLQSLVLDAEKFELNNVCLYYDSWETQIFNSLIRYLFYSLLLCNT